MDWTAFRSLFPVTRSWAFLDHAAVAPLPRPAADAIHQWADDSSANGVATEARWLARVEEVRRAFGALLGCDPLDVAFVKNTSEGVCFVAEGLAWREGDNVVTAEEEYPANVYPWMNLAARGVELRRVPSRHGRIDVADLGDAMDGHTRLVALSFVEYASGYRNDLAAVAELCRGRGALFFVDAIQGLGAFPLDVHALGIDFLAADGHKWLLGPEGAGIFYARRDRVDLLHPISVGWHSVVGAWDFGTIDFRLKPHAGRWESGTFNFAGIVGLGASLDLLQQAGVAAVARRILELTDRLCEQAARVGWTVYSSRRGDERSGIVSLLPPEGRSPRDAVKWLRGRGVIANHRAGRLRVSPHAYNSPDEIDRLVQLLAEMP
jgi:cysteine desulfurase / selenocysteine lyase